MRPRNWTTCLFLRCPSTLHRAQYLNPLRPLPPHQPGVTRSGSNIASRTARHQTPLLPPALPQHPQPKLQARRTRGRQGTSSITLMLHQGRPRASSRNLLTWRGFDTEQRSGRRGGTVQNLHRHCGEMLLHYTSLFPCRYSN